MKSVAILILLCAGASAFGVAQSQPAGKSKADNQVKVEADGTVDLPAESVPVSKFLSPQAKAYLIQHLRDMQDPERTYAEKGVPRFLAPYLERQKALFAVKLEDTNVGGVHVYVLTPTAGVSGRNSERVLINLHGGGFSGCWPGCAELESRPIAALAGIKVVSVDYRQGPENKFPAASEDVATVYRELLKNYKPQNVGIYGCSAGGMLTAESVAWFSTHALPPPGAVGIFCASAGDFGGDASYTSTPLGEARLMPEMRDNAMFHLGYFSKADPNDPMVLPIRSQEILKNFPPTLLITGTRAFEMSSAVHTHAELVKLGVDADLHVWEGLFHGFFYNPDVPESQDALKVMVHFFETRLGPGGTDKRSR